MDVHCVHIPDYPLFYIFSREKSSKVQRIRTMRIKSTHNCLRSLSPSPLASIDITSPEKILRFIQSCVNSISCCANCHTVFAGHASNGVHQNSDQSWSRALAQRHVTRAQGDGCHVRKSQYHLAWRGEDVNICIRYLLISTERTTRMMSAKSRNIETERSKRLLEFHFQCIEKSKADYPS